MSEAVQLALIGMIQSWGNAFWQNIAVIIPAVVGAVILWVQNRRNDKRSEERANGISHQLGKVGEAAVTTAEQAALMAKGAEQRGVELGIEAERLRASDLQSLRTRFQPESTDVFMARTDSPTKE